MAKLITWNLGPDCVVYLIGPPYFKREVEWYPEGQQQLLLRSKYGLVHIHEGSVNRHWIGNQLNPMKGLLTGIIKEHTGVPEDVSRRMMFDTQMVKVKKQKGSVFL